MDEKKIEKLLKNQTKEIDQKLVKQTQEIDQKLAKQTQEIDRKLVKQSKELKEDYGRMGKFLVEEFEKRTQIVAESFTDLKTDHLRLEKKHDHMEQKLDATFEMVGKLVVDMDFVKDELRIIRNELKEKVGRDEFSVLEKRVLFLEKKMMAS